jgi:hypothetical protein
MKSFNAEVIIRHENLNIGDIVYLKPICFKYSTPTLFEVLNRQSGAAEGYIDGNEFRNRFKRI